MNAYEQRVWRATGDGKRIATARDLIPVLHAGRVTLERWFAGQALAMGFTYHPDRRGAVYAQVNTGRWLVYCRCHGAELADPGEPVFFCLSCGNAWNDGHLASVVFPSQRVEGEALLVKRELHNRHWLPGETAGALESENRKHGLD